MGIALGLATEVAVVVGARLVIDAIALRGPVTGRQARAGRRRATLA
jgi:hypothetical protein